MMTLLTIKTEWFNIRCCEMRSLDEQLERAFPRLLQVRSTWFYGKSQMAEKCARLLFGGVAASPSAHESFLTA
jgi:hypothetical protein